MGLITCMYLLACSGQPDLEVEKTYSQIKSLVDSQEKVECRLTSLKDSLDLTWDTINNLIKKNLPKSMSKEECKAIVNVRNADHLRMFQSYNKLDSSVIIAVNDAEMTDNNIALEIISLKNTLNAIGDSINQLRGRINISQREKLEKILYEYKKMKNLESCL
ncbi:MAG: hypothetical protein R2784_14720 [Saprospiraceae bacterium]